MRMLAVLAAAAAVTFAACSSGSDSTPTATSEPDGSATASPTAAPATATPGGTVAPGSGPPSFVALVDLDTGQQVTVQDGPGTWNSWFEPDGQVVSALVLGEGVPPRTVRVALDGTVLLDSATELQVRINADGSARSFGGEAGNGFFETKLEVDGELVDLEEPVTALPVGFSPDGTLLLSYSGAPAAEGEAAIAYAVHDLEGALVASFTNRVSMATGSTPATWSPSGRFVATLGLDGLIAHEVESGTDYLVPVTGATEWSPTEDALLAVAGENELQIIRFPDLEAVSLEVPTTGITASFDPSGQVVAVSDAGRGVTTVFDAFTGEELTQLGGVAEPYTILGFEPVLMTDAGLVAILMAAPGCDGTLVVHPDLGPRGQCLLGINARLSPDGGAVAFTRGGEIRVFDIATVTEQVVASELPTESPMTLARWNADGTHLLLEWPWGGSGWSDSLP